MIKELSRVIFIGLCLICLSCQKDNVKTEGYLDKEFTLIEGQEIHLKQENLTIKFIDVPNDNRCTGVCGWEGSADVIIQITNNIEKTDLLKLNTTNQQGNSTTRVFEQYKIQLIQLDSIGYIFSKYRVTLFVTK